jgi:adenylate cyclase class 2
MNAEHREIEVKLYVPSLDEVRARLTTLGAQLIAPRVFERNIRYENAEGSLYAQGIVIRLRQDTRARLTYKAGGEKVGDDLFARFEAEVEVSDFDTMHVILTQMGYLPSMHYEKYRTTYQLENAEIVLDEMPYGSFVEVEGDEQTIPRALERLNLTHAHRYNAGYAALFEHVRRNLGLTFRDLTFKNFSGILVPEDAFSPPKL